MASQVGQYVVEEITLSESDEDAKYEEVSEDIEETQETDEDYETLLRVTKGIAVDKPAQLQVVESKFTQRHVTTDDFIRNFPA